jgi:Cytochrome c biogenesis factor
MTWVLVSALALIAFGAMIFVFKVPRGAREAVAAALLLGFAGYALQGRPNLPAAPMAPSESASSGSSAIVEARMQMSNKGIPPNNRWVVIADGLTRNGRYAEAASVLRGAVQQDPNNSEAWLAMANNLMAQTEGMLTPASLYAYKRAAKADPENPGPPFFLGMALLQEGKVAEARDLWANMLKRAPEDVPWRGPMEQQLKQIDAFLSRGAPPAPEPSPSRQ